MGSLGSLGYWFVYALEWGHWDVLGIGVFMHWDVLEFEEKFFLLCNAKAKSMVNMHYVEMIFVFSHCVEVCFELL